jgi:hypothetical protein
MKGASERKMGNTLRPLLNQYPFKVAPHHNYTIVFDLQNVHCSGPGFNAAFGLRKEN